MPSKLTKTLIGMGRRGLQGLNVALDSWENDVSGFGTADDKTTYTRFVGGPVLSPQECSNLYHGDDLAARMVDIVGDEMLREGFAADFGDPGLNQAVADKLEALAADTRYADGIRWGRGYGEGAILIGADDGRSAAKPLVPERARDINYLHVMDGRYYWPLTFYQEPGHPLLGEPELFGVMPPGNSGQPTAVVHESRLIRFGGSPTGDQERAANQSRDYSVLQRAYEPLRSFNTGWKAVEILLTDGHQSVFKMQGLAEMIGLDGEALAQARLKIVNMYRSVLRAIVVDAGDKEGGVGAEDFTRNSVSFTAIPDVLDKIMLRLAAAVQIPVTILMGQSPAGMNATGESDFRWFYDRMRSQQNLKLAPKIRKLLRILLATRNWQAKPKALTIKFPPLWTEAPLQAAQTRKTILEGDKLLIDAQAAIPEEVALKRMAPDGFEGELTLTPEARKAREAMLGSQLDQLEAGEPLVPPEGVQPPGTAAKPTAQSPAAPLPSERKLDADDQPRDDLGRFAESDGGGSSSGGGHGSGGAGSGGHGSSGQRPAHEVRHELQKAEQEHEAAQEAHDEAESDLEAAVSDHEWAESEYNDAKGEHESERDEAAEKVESAQEEHDATVAEAQDEHDSAVSDAQEEHDEAVDDSDLEAASEEHAAALKEHEASPSEDTADNLEYAKEKLDQEQADHAKNVERAAAKLGKAKERAAAKLAKAKERAAASLERAKQLAQRQTEKADAKLAKAKSAVDEAKSRVDSERMRLTAAKERLASAETKVSRLQDEEAAAAQ